MNVTQAQQLLRKQLDNHELYHVEAKMNGRLTSAFGRYRYSRLYSHKSVELSTKLVEINDERIKKMQDTIRNLAIDFQDWSSNQSLSLGELSEWQGAIETMAKLVDDDGELIDELKENGII